MERIEYLVESGRVMRSGSFEFDVDWFEGPDYEAIMNRILSINDGYRILEFSIIGYETIVLDMKAIEVLCG